MLFSIFYKIFCFRFIVYNNLKGYFFYLNGRKNVFGMLIILIL